VPADRSEGPRAAPDAHNLAVTVRTQRSGSVLLLVAAAVAAALAVYLPRLGYPPDQYDEGILRSGGFFVTHGLIPYRDFWLPYGPLGPYVVAAASFVTGNDLLGPRLLAMVVDGLTGFLAGILVLGRGPLLAVVATVGTVVIGGIIAPAFGAVGLATALALGAIVLVGAGMDGVDRDRGRRTALVVGLLAGLTALIRPDMGIVIAIVLLLVLRSAWVPVAAAAVAVPVAVAAVITVPFWVLADQLLAFPAIQAQYRTLAPPLLWDAPTPSAAVADFVLIYLPVILLIALTIAAIRRRDVDRIDLALFLFSWFMIVRAVQRADYDHGAEAAVFVIILLIRRVSWLSTVRPATALAAVVGIVAITALSAIGAQPSSTPNPDRDATVRYVQSHAAPGDALFVALPTNRVTLVNDASLYADLRMGPCSRFTMFDPGVTDTDATQAEIVAELDATSCRWVVLAPVPIDVTRELASTLAPRSATLDADLAAEYRPVAQFGGFTVLERSAAGSPP
jgi:hypothetical protein